MITRQPNHLGLLRVNRRGREKSAHAILKLFDIEAPRGYELGQPANLSIRLFVPPPSKGEEKMSPRKMTCWAVMAAALSATTAMAAAPRRGKDRQGPGTGRRNQSPARQGPRLLQPQVDRRSITRDCKTNDEKADRHLQLHAVEPLSFRLSGRAGRVARAEGNQLLRLEPLRRPALRGIGPVAATRLGLAVRRLGRAYHGRGQLRRPSGTTSTLS